ncbi:MAG: PTS sugar transporter subunit IIA, partial [Oscillospiraceae bacterium]|nr:PTS sugar transporter subunit IIA [Oscillospiraceae bacterium]
SLPQAPSRYCAPALFFPELDADTPEKILQLLGQRLQELGLADDAFQGAVLERERISPTAFEPGIALPHALRVPAGRTAVAAARLKRPVWWGDQKVQLVILPALSAGDLPAIGRFLALGPLFQHDRRLFDQLLAAQDFPAFFALLDRIF